MTHVANNHDACGAPHNNVIDGEDPNVFHTQDKALIDLLGKHSLGHTISNLQTLFHPIGRTAIAPEATSFVVYNMSDVEYPRMTKL